MKYEGGHRRKRRRTFDTLTHFVAVEVGVNKKTKLNGRIWANGGGDNIKERFNNFKTFPIAFSLFPLSPFMF